MFDTVSKRFLEAVDQRISLPETERSQVHTIIVDHLARQREILREAHAEGLPLPPGIRAALEQQNQDTEKKLRNLLTEKQLAEYVQIREEQREELWKELRAGKEGRLQEK